MDILVSTDVRYGEYIKDISTFKGEYLVTVSDTNTGDSMQFIKIYDKNLNLINSLGNNGAITVHQGYDNYFTVGENEITFIYTDGEEKVTSKIAEKDGKLAIEEIERTTEGVKTFEGRT